MKTAVMVDILEELYPSAYQEKYDNAGPQILFPEDEVTSVLVALDIDQVVVDEAVASGVNCIITHHPLFFKGTSSIIAGDPYGDIVISLIEKRISLIAVHTNMDKIYFDELARQIGLENSSPLITENSIPDIGLGSIGSLKEAVSFKDLIAQVLSSLNLPGLTASGDPDRMVSRIALINGAGGSSIEKIIRKNQPHCIITGDVKYHHVKYAQLSCTPVINAGHYGTEKPMMQRMMRDIYKSLTNRGLEGSVQIQVSEKEQDPEYYVIKDQL